MSVAGGRDGTGSVDPGVSAGLEASVSALSLRLLGGFDLRVGGESVSGLRSKSEQWLLALLVLRSDRDTDRGWLAETLWPESLPERSRFYLRRALSSLRTALGSEGGRVLSPSPGTVRLELSGAWCDVLEFDAALRGADPASLSTALELYSGPLLEGCSHEWAVRAREERHQGYVRTLEMLAAQSRARRDYAEEIHLLRRAIAADPLRESLHARLMEAHAAGGDSAAVMQVYRELRLLLHREINSAPAPETTALFERLRVRPPAMPAGKGDRTPPHSRLPHPVGRLIGREAAVAEVAGLLATHRLVTLTGPGGVGKTRLALQVAREQPESDAGEAYFIDLSSVTDADFVARTVAGVIGVREAPGVPVLETIATRLRERSALLVFDNCEHLLTGTGEGAGCTGFVARLPEGCPHLRVLATSREVLRIPGEVVWPVPPLQLPPGHGGFGPTATSEELRSCASVRLFLDRWRPGNSSPDGLERIAEICRRVDGLPLAIELAAARARTLPLEEICARLEDRFRLLSHGSRSAQPRQQTLRALIDWSYDLLSEEQRRLFRRLSVFSGGWTLEAGGHVAGSPEGFLDTHTALVEKSLLHYEESERRYRMLETIREYAWERLQETGDAGFAVERHGEYFSDLLQRKSPSRADTPPEPWLDTLERDIGNFRAALDRAAEAENTDAELRLCAGLWGLWMNRGYLREGRARIESALRGTGGTPLLRAKVLQAAWTLAYLAGDYPSARAFLDDGLALARECGDPVTTAVTLAFLGGQEASMGALEAATGHLTESLDLARRIGERSLLGIPTFGLGLVARSRGELERALELFAECRGLFAAPGDRWWLAQSLLGIATCLQRLDRPAEAIVEYREGLALCRDLRDNSATSWFLESLAGLAVASGRISDAATLMGASDGLRAGIGGALVPELRAQRAKIEAIVRADLGEADRSQAHARGEAMHADDAISFALRVL